MTVLSVGEIPCRKTVAEENSSNVNAVGKRVTSAKSASQSKAPMSQLVNEMALEIIAKHSVEHLNRSMSHDP